MPSRRYFSYNRSSSCEKRVLQRLRREAGYHSAREFALTLDIPASTYARYERAQDGSQCGIPLSAAWKIADALDCSIDLIVGREDARACEPDDLHARIDALTRSSRDLLEQYLGFLEQRDQEDNLRARR
jgi:transcriptional regulator with XRE-family HTH domain